jgi:hypothetical protein
MYGLLEYAVMERTEHAEICTLGKTGPWPNTGEVGNQW